MTRAPRRIFVLLALGGALARASAADTAVPVPSVESPGPAGYRVRVPTGEPQVIRGDVMGHALAEIVIPGAEPSVSTPGQPPLPARTVFLRAPWGVRASVTSSAGAARSLGALRLAPLPRLLTDARARALATPDALERAMRSASPRGAASAERHRSTR